MHVRLVADRDGIFGMDAAVGCAELKAGQELRFPHLPPRRTRCGPPRSTSVEADRCQYRRKLTSTVIITGTGLPARMAGLKRYLRTASSAFSSRPMPRRRTTRGLRGMP